MTRVVLIHAGPTKWDLEDRLAGSHSLPLAAYARITIAQLINNLTDSVEAVYAARSNEACDEVAKMLAAKFKLRPRDSDELLPIHLGLWEGLRRDELRRRFTEAFSQWEEAPAIVHPPDGETLDEAIARLRSAMARILRRNKSGTIAIALRTTAFQIVAGLLRNESLDQIASHLHNEASVANIDLS